MIVQIALIALKLCNVIAWPWVWVLTPLRIGAIISVLWFVLHDLLIWRVTR